MRYLLALLTFIILLTGCSGGSEKAKASEDRASERIEEVEFITELYEAGKISKTNFENINKAIQEDNHKKLEEYWYIIATYLREQDKDFATFWKQKKDDGVIDSQELLDILKKNQADLMKSVRRDH